MPAVMEQINEMSHAEKLQVMDMLWTSILSSSGAVEPPAWHADVLAERRRRVEAGEEVVIPWEDTRRQLSEEFA